MTSFLFPFPLDFKELVSFSPLSISLPKGTWTAFLQHEGGFFRFFSLLEKKASGEVCDFDFEAHGRKIGRLPPLTSPHFFLFIFLFPEGR